MGPRDKDAVSFIRQVYCLLESTRTELSLLEKIKRAVTADSLSERKNDLVGKAQKELYPGLINRTRE